MRSLDQPSDGQWRSTRLNPSQSAWPGPTATRVENLAASLNRLHISSGGGGGETPPSKKAEAAAGRRSGVPGSDMVRGYLRHPFEVLPKRLVQVVEDNLYAHLLTHLSASDDAACGHVYVLRSARLPHLVKVGSGQRLEQRVKQIGAKCKRLGALELVHVVQFVRHPRRVEKLVHAHLEALKEEWWCEAEGITHGEWFRCGPYFAKDVVEAWAGWMKREPYADGVLQSSWLAEAKRLGRGLALGYKDEGAEEMFEEVFERHRRWMRS